jgi:acetyl esterase/lipase
MTTDAFHPDLAGVARWLPRSPVNRHTLPVIRLLSGLSAKQRAKDVRVETVGAATVRVHRPPDPGRLAALLWIHGGGYVMGTAGQDDALCRHFAQTLGIVVAAVDYRLAPESPFPAPLDDCYRALTWLADQPEIDASRIAVGGASAGGGLAAALALMARDRGEVQLAFQLLSYPMLDDRTAIRTDIDERKFRLWNNKSNRFGWQSYTGLLPGSTAVTGLAAPARSEDLTRLPPAWIGVGTFDLFHGEDLTYAARLGRAGVDCAVVEVEGAFHGFDLVRPKAGVSEMFRQSQRAALAAALH